jgi:hypothetical protein
MAPWYYRECDHCNYPVLTSGPWEFYRDRDGRKQNLRYEIYETRDRNRRVDGLWGEVYCFECETVFDVVLVEFKEPSQDSVQALAGLPEPKDEFRNKDAVKCPRCGGTNLLLGYAKGTGLDCPRCKEGQLVLKVIS